MGGTLCIPRGIKQDRPSASHRTRNTNFSKTGTLSSFTSRISQSDMMRQTNPVSDSNPLHGHTMGISSAGNQLLLSIGLHPSRLIARQTGNANMELKKKKSQRSPVLKKSFSVSSKNRRLPRPYPDYGNLKSTNK